jgi:hypothetical protein
MASSAPRGSALTGGWRGCGGQALADGLSSAGRPHELLVLGAGHLLAAEEEAARGLDAELTFSRKIMAG